MNHSIDKILQEWYIISLDGSQVRLKEKLGVGACWRLNSSAAWMACGMSKTTLAAAHPPQTHLLVRWAMLTLTNGTTSSAPRRTSMRVDNFHFSSNVVKMWTLQVDYGCRVPWLVRWKLSLCFRRCSTRTRIDRRVWLRVWRWSHGLVWSW